MVIYQNIEKGMLSEIAFYYSQASFLFIEDLKKSNASFL